MSVAANEVVMPPEEQEWYVDSNQRRKSTSARYALTGAAAFGIRIFLSCRLSLFLSDSQPEDVLLTKMVVIRSCCVNCCPGIKLCVRGSSERLFIVWHIESCGTPASG
jgi:hypothetical protein